jgi:hypothetical protein
MALFSVDNTVGKKLYVVMCWFRFYRIFMVVGAVHQFNVSAFLIRTYVSCLKTTTVAQRNNKSRLDSYRPRKY